MSKVAFFPGNFKYYGIHLGSTQDFALENHDFTVEAWIKIKQDTFAQSREFDSSYPGNGQPVLGTPFLSGPWDGHANTGLYLGVKNQRAHFSFFRNDTQGSRILLEERWYHLAWRYANGVQTIFVNGLIDAFNQNRPAFEGRNLPTYAGLASSPQHDMLEYFSGKLSNLRIWNHGVSDRLIRDRWTQDLNEPGAGLDESEESLSKSKEGLISYWPLDDLDSAPEDRIRNVRGAVEGAVVSVDDENLPVFVEQQVEGVVFDGSRGLDNIPNLHSLIPADTESFVIDAWVRPGGVALKPWQQPIIAQSGPSTGWELRAGSHAEFMLTNSSGKHKNLTSISPLQANVWQHVMGYYDGTHLSIYVNGLRDNKPMPLEGKPSWFNGTISIADNPNFAAFTDSERKYRGQIGSIRIWVGSEVDPIKLSSTAMWDPLVHDLGLRAVYRLGAADSMPDETRKLIAERGLTFGKFTKPPELGEDWAQLSSTKIIWGEPVAKVDTIIKDREDVEVKLDRAWKENSLLLEQIDTLTTDLKKQEKKIKEQAKRIKMMDVLNDDETTLDAFIVDMREKIENARTSTAISNSNYRLGRVSLQARVLPGDRGNTFRFPDLGEVDGSMLTTIDLDFDTTSESDANPVQQQSQVPDVLGYTEPKARRVLVNAGFISDINLQAVGPDSSGKDRVVSQHPAPLARLAQGSSVIIFIGKES